MLDKINAWGNYFIPSISNTQHRAGLSQVQFMSLCYIRASHNMGSLTGQHCHLDMLPTHWKIHCRPVKINKNKFSL